MFDSGTMGDSSVVLLAGLIDTLNSMDQGVGDAVRIDRIALLEKLKSAAAAAQAVETARRSPRRSEHISWRWKCRRSAPIAG